MFLHLPDLHLVGYLITTFTHTTISRKSRYILGRFLLILLYIVLFNKFPAFTLYLSKRLKIYVLIPYMKSTFLNNLLTLLVYS